MPEPAEIERRRAVRAILREHRRDGCAGTREALAMTIYELRMALADLQRRVLAQDGGGRHAD